MGEDRSERDRNSKNERNERGGRGDRGVLIGGALLRIEGTVQQIGGASRREELDRQRRG